jgi:hypothetical protein
MDIPTGKLDPGELLEGMASLGDNKSEMQVKYACMSIPISGTKLPTYPICKTLDHNKQIINK